jgi:hypothetical protein
MRHWIVALIIVALVFFGGVVSAAPLALSLPSSTAAVFRIESDADYGVVFTIRDYQAENVRKAAEEEGESIPQFFRKAGLERAAKVNQ